MTWKTSDEKGIGIFYQDIAYCFGRFVWQVVRLNSGCNKISLLLMFCEQQWRHFCCMILVLFLQPWGVVTGNGQDADYIEHVSSDHASFDQVIYPLAHPAICNSVLSTNENKLFCVILYQVFPTFRLPAVRVCLHVTNLVSTVKFENNCIKYWCTRKGFMRTYGNEITFA